MNKICFLLLLYVVSVHMKLIDDSLQCPPGSVVNPYTNTCSTCSNGYYEQNNTYFECPIETTNYYRTNYTYNIYNNEKSFAYITTGGYNYDDSYIHKKNIFNVDNFVKPIAEKIIQIIAKIYNNRKILNSGLIGFAIVLGCTLNVHY